MTSPCDLPDHDCQTFVNNCTLQTTYSGSETHCLPYVGGTGICNLPINRCNISLDCMIDGDFSMNVGRCNWRLCPKSNIDDCDQRANCTGYFHDKFGCATYQRGKGVCDISKEACEESKVCTIEHTNTVEECDENVRYIVPETICTPR